MNGESTAAATNAATVAADVLGPRARRREPLGALTTYRVGGPAALFLRVEDDDDLGLAAAAVAASGIEVLVVGKGSNLLVSDAGFPGLAVVLGTAFEGLQLLEAHGQDEGIVRAGAALALPVLARRTAAEGLRGMEWAVGVPGSVGGGVRMNAGGHGSDMAASVVAIRAFDLASGEHVVVEAAPLDLGYRRSALPATSVVTEVTLRLAPGDPVVAGAEVAEVVRWRRAHQPGGQNAGSVFTNPEGDSAGRLVEAAGCKGLRVGTAAVSAKHANFIQADDGGRADDVAALIQIVRQRVLDHSGIELRPEVRQIGFDKAQVEVDG